MQIWDTNTPSLTTSKPLPSRVTVGSQKKHPQPPPSPKTFCPDATAPLGGQAIPCTLAEAFHLFPSLPLKGLK